MLMLAMYFCAVAPVSATRPRSWRLRLPLLWLLRCFLPAWLRFSLPLADTRNRFLEALWLFCLGMVQSSAPVGACVVRKRSCPRRGTSIVETDDRTGQG